MKMTINESDFHDAFQRMGRDNQFSYEGRAAIFDWLEELERDTGDEMELDVIAICCEWAEYASPSEAALVYSWDMPERDDDETDDAYDERANDEAFEWLVGKTQAVPLVDGGVVILQF